MTTSEHTAWEQEAIGHETTENSDALAERLELFLQITGIRGGIKQRSNMLTFR